MATRSWAPATHRIPLRRHADRVHRFALASCLGLATLVSSTCAHAEEPSQAGIFVSADGHLSLLSDIVNSTLLNPTFGWAVKGGYRPGDWGLFLQVEQDVWQPTDSSGKTVLGALSVALGGEMFFADGFLRSSVAVGSSTLLFDTVLDDAGSTGIFFDLRPTGLRWYPSDHFVINFDPLSFAIVAPVLTGIPLIQVEYRTVVGVESRF